MAAEAARTDAATTRQKAHAVLSKPAILSLIFKFAFRERGEYDVLKLIAVGSAWEDTAIHYCPWIWQHLGRARGDDDAPPLPGTPSIEEYSRHLFDYHVHRRSSIAFPAAAGTLKKGGHVARARPS